MQQKYPKVGSVKIHDRFWFEYLNNICRITLPYVFGKMEETDYLTNFYSVINKAYLETCAAIRLAFWNGEMNLVNNDSKYFDCFERTLYNNILSAVGGGFEHFFYQNPLESDGTLKRWDWHGVPCCPPMLLKIFSSLGSYIYSYNEESISINMHIASTFENEFFSVAQSDNEITLDSKGKKMILKIRIPEYVDDFCLKLNGNELKYSIENGYAVMQNIWYSNSPLTITYRTNVRRIYANPKVCENLGKVAVSYGQYIMCAEGIDNGGNVDIEIAENPYFELKGDNIIGKSASGSDFCLIPYYKWCNRAISPDDAKMSVWLKQQNMRESKFLATEIGEKLYEVYR